MFPVIGVVLLLCIHSSLAATITYDFNVTWLLANPDGLYPRPVIGINNQFPIPPIVGTLGDRVIVNVNNQLGNQSTSLHFHGLFQNGTAHMDGPVQVSQCPIPPGSSYTYNFTVCYK
jgi:iron transport multicopper oxidase